MGINGSTDGSSDGSDQPEITAQGQEGKPAPEGFASDTFNLIAEHKGKLAVGAAAALGLMIFYNWREKTLAEEDPEDYARLKKFTAPFKPADEIEQEEFERKMRQQGGSAAL